MNIKANLSIILGKTSPLIKLRTKSVYTKENVAYNESLIQTSVKIMILKRTDQTKHTPSPNYTTHIHSHFNVTFST